MVPKSTWAVLCAESSTMWAWMILGQEWTGQNKVGRRGVTRSCRSATSLRSGEQHSQCTLQATRAATNQRTCATLISPLRAELLGVMAPHAARHVGNHSRRHEPKRPQRQRLRPQIFDRLQGCHCRPELDNGRRALHLPIGTERSQRCERSEEGIRRLLRLVGTPAAALAAAAASMATAAAAAAACSATAAGCIGTAAGRWFST